MARGVLGTGFLALFLTALASGCGEEPIPETVEWDPTMRQLFAAHCVRCHGAGGTLNPDPFVLQGNDAPGTAYLDEPGDRGCAIDPATGFPPPTCKRGAIYVKDTIKLYIRAPVNDVRHMPPVPAAPLTERELALIDRWVDSQP